MSKWRYWCIAVVSWLVRLPLKLLLIRVKVEGREHIPAGGAILANNHRSFIDGLLLWAKVNQPMVFMATRGVFNLPVVGQLLWLMGFIPVYRGERRTATSGMATLDRATRIARSGMLVGMYPEGGIVTPTRPRRIKRGVAYLHKQGIPVLPVLTEGAAHIMPMHGPWHRWVPRLWRQAKVTILAQLPHDYSEWEVVHVLESEFQHV